VNSHPNDRRLYEAAEDAAKVGKLGLWRDADPVARHLALHREHLLPGAWSEGNAVGTPRPAAA